MKIIISYFDYENFVVAVAVAVFDGNTFFFIYNSLFSFLLNIQRFIQGKYIVC